MVSYWLPGATCWPSSLGGRGRNSCQHGRATSQPGPTCRMSGDNVTGHVRSLGLCLVKTTFLEVFPLPSKCVTRKRQWTLHRGFQTKKQWKTIPTGMSNSIQLLWKRQRDHGTDHITLVHSTKACHQGESAEFGKALDLLYKHSSDGDPQLVVEGWSMMCSDTVCEFWPFVL